MGYSDALSSIMPIEWLDPYGRTPFADGMETSVDITIVETDDGIRASSVKNPPKSGPSRLMQAIQQALGVDSLVCESPCSSLQAADLGKCDKEKSDDSDGKSQKNGIMSSTSPPGSEVQGLQPWPGGKSEGTLTTDKAAGSRGGDEQSKGARNI